MEYRFKAEVWANLTPAERVRRCRLMATEAQALAENASPNLTTRYLQIADGWLSLANDIEQTIDGSSGDS
jgi:hypothetical protein